ncbi:MAG: zinc ribbon domain-containing protein [Candidatus Poribacteria bacterium]|nr:zinc ribbon domain-containing protein [Candidatus Poribacteria bacterium]
MSRYHKLYYLGPSAHGVIPDKTERTYHCSQCDVSIDRDVNAAINLRNLHCRIDREAKRLWSSCYTNSINYFLF